MATRISQLTVKLTTEDLSKALGMKISRIDNLDYFTADATTKRAGVTLVVSVDEEIVVCATPAK